MPGRDMFGLVLQYMAYPRAAVAWCCPCLSRRAGYMVQNARLDRSLPGPGGDDGTPTDVRCLPWTAALACPRPTLPDAHLVRLAVAVDAALHGSQAGVLKGGASTR